MQSETHRLEQRLNKRLSSANKKFGMVNEGDKILVCLSGGKDSYAMLSLLIEARKRWPINFEMVAFHLDQKQPGYPPHIMEDYLKTVEGITYDVVEKDTYSIVMDKLGENMMPCSLCSRLRRGIMYSYAEKHGCNKIALGHHRDDTIETLLLNLFHNGKTRAMPAKYRTDDERFEVIRPLIYIAEADIQAFSDAQGYPIIPCNLCGSIEGQRKYIKTLLSTLESDIPGVRGSLLSALAKVHPSHLLDENIERKVLE